jgi:hypothetical protein
MSTRVDFCWAGGAQLETLLEKLESYLTTRGLSLMGRNGRNPHYPAPLGEKPYQLWWSAETSPRVVESQEPWLLQPITNPAFRRLTWEFFDSADRVWFWCSISRNPEEEATDPDPSWRSVIDGKLVKMRITFDEELRARSDDEEWRRRFLQKYQQVKELFHLLDADLVRAWSDRYWGGFETEKDDPDFNHQVFRFAKSGRQFFLAPLEQGRVPRPDETMEEMRIAG